jgi:hypothetical protein
MWMAIHPFALCGVVPLRCCPSACPFALAVGSNLGLHATLKLRDLAILAVHGRHEANPAAPATLLPSGSYSNQQVQRVAAKLQVQVGDLSLVDWL